MGTFQSPYIWLIVLACGFHYFDYFKINKWPSLMLSILLVLVAGTRFETGNDWGEYTFVFKNISPLFHPQKMLFRMETGYLFLNRLLKTLGAQHVGVVFFVCAAFSLYAFRKIALRYSVLPMFSFVLYMRYFYFQTNTMFVRQGMAISIFMLAMPLIMEKKKWRYILTILLAATFHLSALLVIPLYWFYNWVLHKKSLIVLVFICLVFTQLRWLEVFASLIPFPLIKHIVLSYISSERWGVPVGLSLSVIERFVMFFILYNYRDRLLQMFPKTFNLYFNMFFIGFCISLIFYQYNVFLERFILYFNVANLFVIPYIVMLFNMSSKVILTTAICLFCAFWYVRFVYAPDSVYIPYQSFLFR